MNSDASRTLTALLQALALVAACSVDTAPTEPSPGDGSTPTAPVIEPSLPDPGRPSGELPATPAPGAPPAAAPIVCSPQQSLAPLVSRLQPSVVNIYATKLHAQYNPLAPFFFPNQPQVTKEQSLGSGFVYDAGNGLVVTNHHVIAKANEVKVRLSDRRELDARLLGSDPQTDIALLQVSSPEKLQAVVIGDSDRLQVGDWVLAIGNPFGLSQTVTVGIVSALSRTIGAGPYDDFIQTDASINPGNSGGPLFDMEGRVVGINTAIHREGQGIGFAIPMSLAEPLLDQIRTTGRVARSQLGVIIQDVTPEIAAAMGLDPPSGALVNTVMPGSPAALAGVMPGDVILQFNGHEIATSRNLPTQVARTRIGEQVALIMFRRGSRQELQVNMSAMPPPQMPPGYGQPWVPGTPGTPGPSGPPQGWGYPRPYGQP